MPSTAPTRAAIYVKEAAGYPDGENSKELQTEECEKFCLAQEFKITTRYYDSPGSRHQFGWMMGEATDENPPFDVIVVCKLKNFSWSLDETVLCRARLKPTGLTATASHDQVVLTWEDPNDSSITGYMILRRNRDTDAKGEFTTLVEDTGSADTTHADGSVAAETRYTYRIKAINEHGVSERSRWFHIDTPAATTPAP